MTGILTAEEIAALLGAYRTAEGRGTTARENTANRQVRLYDFARPDKFSREHINTLRSIHSKYAASFALALTGLLRAPVKADLLSVDQVAYRDYRASVMENALLCEVGLEPLANTALFEFGPAVAGACIDGLTGGSGAASQGVDLTDIDRAIMAKVVDELLRRYTEAWAPYLGISARLHESIPHGSSSQAFLPTEPVLVCAFEVGVAEFVGMMSICVPASAVEAILPALAAGRAMSPSTRHAPAVAQAVHDSLQGVEMECRAILGRTTLTMADVVNLGEGDLIRLDAKPNSEIEFWVGGRHACFAVPGRSGQKLGLRVTRLVEGDHGQEQQE